MEARVLLTTGGSMLCLCDENGTIIGWIPYPQRRDAVGPGREKVYLARPLAVPVPNHPRRAA
ncbi:MAG: hypothetical protein H3C62_16180 [Gemmatimonadaceae bacterium]|nr:hypothetical protein [Gemmatimonadaceae bacterium]